MRSTRRPARATAAPSSTRDRRLHQSSSPTRCRPIRSPSCSALGRKHFAPLEDYPGGAARSGGRASSASRAGSPAGRAQRRANLAAIHAEIRGRLEIPLGDGAFTLTRAPTASSAAPTARYAILDYKTGQPRTGKQVRSGLAPQLTLEAAILRGGGFADIPAGASVGELAYVLLHGGEPPGETSAIDFKEGTPDSQADDGAAPAHGHRACASPTKTTPYRSLVHPMWTHPLRRLRPSRAREGMVGDRRRGRGGMERREMNARRVARFRATSRAAVRRSRRPIRAVSACVSANAGSGKTHVLAQRVIRLLLDGVDPAKILCLTFTKAAAANMANRVFDTLAKWTTLDDAALDERVARSSAQQRVDAARRAQARRLFAAALETPGGLKVQTIHAFCTRLLHQFPFEANVAARFTVLDERAEAELLDQLALEVLLEAAAAPDSPLGRALATRDHRRGRSDLQGA